MRDYLLALLIFIPTIWALRAPWIGVLAWTVLSIMNPHRLSWVLYSMPVAATVAGATVLGLLFNRKDWKFTFTAPTVVFMLLALWFCITYPFSFNLDNSYYQWSKVMKIDFMILISMGLIHTKRQIIALLWTLVISLGLYGVKGGIFTLATGGSHHVWGPEGTFIEGNNELALALIMVIPLMQVLRYESSNLWIRRGLLAAMGLTTVSSVGSQSRGALLALAAMAAVLWWRGKNRLGAGITMIVMAALLAGFLPDSWFQRMNTIGEYQEDGSALGRINAWWMAWNLARANFFGGGFDIYTPQVFSQYAPVPDDLHAAHSIYFQILGEHGFVGLALFVILWLLVWRMAGQLRRCGRARAETQWVSHLGAMTQVSLVAYGVGGAFLSLAYFDLPYYLLVLMVVGSQWMKIEEYNAPAGALGRDLDFPTPIAGPRRSTLERV